MTGRGPRLGGGGPGRAGGARPDDGGSAAAVFANRGFMLLWLSQVATQVGGNMVIYGLTVLIFSLTGSNSAVSFLLLTFLVPAVIFSAVAGVYVDRLDRRLVLVTANLLRAGAFGLMLLVNTNLVAIYALNIVVSIVTTFFAPAELAMIPRLVARNQLLAANGIFTLTLNAAFAVGFALAGPLLVTVSGPEALILVVAVFYLVAAVFCFTLPPAPPSPTEPVGVGAVAEAEAAVSSVLAQFGEGIGYIRRHRNAFWSLLYLGITSSLIGVLGVLGPDYATEALQLGPKDFVVVVLPLGAGVVMGVLLLNAYGKYVPRRRIIEAGLVVLGLLLVALAVAGPIATFLQDVRDATKLVPATAVVSLLTVVVVIGFLAGVAYSAVAIPAQTQLQEEIPEEVRGRVFGILNMLVSIGSFLPIVAVGPISDVVGTTPVLISCALLVTLSGVASVLAHRRVEPAAATLVLPAPDAQHPSAPHDPLATALRPAESRTAPRGAWVGIPPEARLPDTPRPPEPVEAEAAKPDSGSRGDPDVAGAER